MFAKNINELIDKEIIVPQGDMWLFVKKLFSDNPTLKNLKKDTETSEGFITRIGTAFYCERYLANKLYDIHYGNRITDTTDWNSFSWDVLDTFTGARVEVKVVKDHDQVITFADYSMKAKRFSFDGDKNFVGNTIHIDNFVNPNSIADAIVVFSCTKEEDYFLIKTRIIADKIVIMNGYCNNGPSLFCKSKLNNGGMYIQGHYLCLPSWMENKIFVNNTEIVYKD